MKLIVRAGGVMKRGPERELVDDYLKRSAHLARTIGMAGVEEQEVNIRSCKDRAESTEKIFDFDIPSRQIIVLDERGKAITSRGIANHFTQIQESGVRELYFVIGEADGLEPSLIPGGCTKWSFGSQTWPHKLVRVMICEQIYRALSILGGTPYHRD